MHVFSCEGQGQGRKLFKIYSLSKTVKHLKQNKMLPKVKSDCKNKMTKFLIRNINLKQTGENKIHNSTTPIV